jgi:putative DNA primase/helicase
MKVFTDPFEANSDLPKFVLRSISTYLDGRRRAAEFYIWTGLGSNGKSTIQELVIATLGPYAKPLDISFWTKPKGSSSACTPELANMWQARFAFSNEPEATDKLQAARIKEITGGERVTARALHRMPIIFRPKFGVFILCNIMPQFSVLDGGISRRVRVVSFRKIFKQPHMSILPGDVLADPSVMQNCRCNIEWRQALMRILLDTYQEVKDMSEDIPLPEEVRLASSEYLEDNNPVGEWLRNNYDISNDHSLRIKASDLYNDYICEHDRNDRMNGKLFGVAVNQINKIPKKKLSDGAYYLGLQRKPAANMLIKDDDDELA